MNKITLMVGISGSGKSYMAQQLRDKSPNTIILSRDSFREMLYGYTPQTVKEHYSHPDFSKREQVVSRFLNDSIRAALLDGLDVIVDNTHLEMKWINKYLVFGVPIEFAVMNCSLETAIDRDNKRVRKVGEKVIRAQYDKFQTLKKNFGFRPIVPDWEPIVCDPNLPNCVIWDIDGTLAIKGNRSPFEWHRVGEDAVNTNIKILMDHVSFQDFSSHCKPIICSGRDEVCRSETMKWLKKNDIDYDVLFMRKQNDNRADYIIKEEFWREISKKYYIVALIDDRQQVVDHARRLGLTCCQVNYGNF